MSILIDDRAGSRDLITHAPLNTTAELCRLTAADICIMGNGPSSIVSVGVEFKSLGDLIASMNNGRLQETQIPGMLREFDCLWLLTYGSYRAGADGSLQIMKNSGARGIGAAGWARYRIGSRVIPYGYVESFLLTCAALGIRHKHVESVAAAAQWLGVLARWWQKPWTDHTGMHALDLSRDVSLMPGLPPALIQRIRTISTLPGLGYSKGRGRAVAAATHFPSIRAAAAASEAEWCEVEGIGKGVARAVVEALK